MPDKIAQLRAEIENLKERMRNSTASPETLAQMQQWLKEKEATLENETLAQMQQWLKEETATIKT